MSQLLGKVIFLKEYLRKWCKIYNFVPEASSSPKHLSFNYVNVPIYVIWEKAEKSSYSGAWLCLVIFSLVFVKDPFCAREEREGEGRRG
ncbi:hypothetical protein R3W88_027849 [Solanum pinnatisectum]|uniref:Uncharacterized protein n=1 Tax=Solanum pinnatisectum TaxID=50273 RepID=A0AAV9LJP7_9SOLN|nr:hypothetical protein R3W88_027849 [Solanum pinnatisectum]